MTSTKRFLTRALFAAYAAKTAQYENEYQHFLTPRIEGNPRWGRAIIRTVGATALLAWPVLVPLYKVRAVVQDRKARAEVLDAIKRYDDTFGTPWEWPDDWQDDLTPEQEAYWQGEPDDDEGLDDLLTALGLTHPVFGSGVTILGAYTPEDPRPDPTRPL